MTPANQLSGKNKPCSEGFNTHLWCYLRRYDGKMFIFQSKPRHVTPQIDCLGKTWALFWGFQHTFMVVTKEIDGKMFIFRVNLGMWPLKLIVLEKRALFWEFQHTIYAVLPRQIWWKNIHFSTKPRHVSSSNQSSWRNEACAESSNSHLYRFQADRWKNVHFSTKPRHVTPQIDHLGKTSPVLRVLTHTFMGFLRR